MKLTTLAAVGVALAGAAAFSANTATAAQVYETYSYISSSSSVDYANLFVTNNDGGNYSDVMIDGVDLGPLAAGASTTPLNVGDPGEGAPTFADIAFTLDGVTTSGTASVVDYDVATTTPVLQGTVAPAVSAAPEPSAWALMFLGVGVAGAALRSSRRARIVPA